MGDDVMKALLVIYGGIQTVCLVPLVRMAWWSYGRHISHDQTLHGTDGKGGVCGKLDSTRSRLLKVEQKCALKAACDGSSDGSSDGTKSTDATLGRAVRHAVIAEARRSELAKDGAKE